MSMQSYGFSEILLDMEKAKKVAKEEYEEMMMIIAEENPSPYDIHIQEYSSELKHVIDNFINKIYLELAVDIYPYYVSSEADGTDLAGEIIWCIEPEYKENIKNAMSEIESWSEFG